MLSNKSPVHYTDTLRKLKDIKMPDVNTVGERNET
jgi:hypothetical protein